jgi:hypothetical protein
MYIHHHKFSVNRSYFKDLESLSIIRLCSLDSVFANYPLSGECVDVSLLHSFSFLILISTSRHATVSRAHPLKFDSSSYFRRPFGSLQRTIIYVLQSFDILVSLGTLSQPSPTSMILNTVIRVSSERQKSFLCRCRCPPGHWCSCLFQIMVRPPRRYATQRRRRRHWRCR